MIGKTWKKILATALIGILIVGSTGCGKEEKKENKDTNTSAATATDKVDDNGKFDPDSIEDFTIRVGVNSGDNNQYLKILDDHTNFLKDKGITLETTEFAAGINTIDAITTGNLDVGLFADYAGVNRIGNTIQDTELRAFAMINKSNAFQLYVDPQQVKEVKDLEGKTAISMAGVVYEYDYGKLFDTYQIDKDKVELANVSSIQEALALAAAGDAVSFWVSAQMFSKFEEQGWKPLVGLEDIDATMYTYLVANNSYLTEHKNEVAKFIQASDEGFSYISEHLDEFAEWVEADLGLDKQLVIKGWESQSHGYTFPQEAYEDLVKVEKWCYENGNFDTDYEPADFINTDALQLVFPDRVSWSKN